MTVEEGARLRAVSHGNCRHATVVAERLTSGETTGAYVCTTCGELLSVSSLINVQKLGLTLTPTFRPLRRYRRVAVQRPAWVWVEGERQPIRATCVSLSIGGAAFHADEALEPGMSGQFVVVMDDGTAVLVECGSVQWASHREFGVEFIAMAEEDHSRLQQYISANATVLCDDVWRAARDEGV